jgi:uncharacterized membrane protein YheB (UPF0754 family)
MAKKLNKKTESKKPKKTAKVDKKTQKAVKNEKNNKPIIQGIITVEEKEIDEEKISPDALEALIGDVETPEEEMDLGVDDDDDDDAAEAEEADWE